MVRSRSLMILGAELSSPEQSVRPHLPLRTGATFRFCRWINEFYRLIGNFEIYFEPISAPDLSAEI
jgi:hypothetical protein